MHFPVSCIQTINVAIIATKVDAVLPSDGGKSNRSISDEPPLLVAGLRGVRDDCVDMRQREKQRVSNSDRFIALIKLQSRLPKGGLNRGQLSLPLKVESRGELFR